MSLSSQNSSSNKESVNFSIIDKTSSFDFDNDENVEDTVNSSMKHHESTEGINNFKMEEKI